MYDKIKLKTNTANRGYHIRRSPFILKYISRDVQNIVFDYYILPIAMYERITQGKDIKLMIFGRIILSKPLLNPETDENKQRKNADLNRYKQSQKNYVRLKIVCNNVI